LFGFGSGECCRDGVLDEQSPNQVRKSIGNAPDEVDFSTNPCKIWLYLVTH
jgi:hypothetical protein